MAHLVLRFYTVATVLFSLHSIFSANAFLIKRTLSPASNASLPGNWTYVGCWDDNVNGNGRTLAGSSYADATNMNASACVSFCQGRGYVYAGTEYTDECYCGDALVSTASRQSDSSCSMGCAYNVSEACGGGNLLTVYYANEPTPQGPFVNPGPPGWTSFGCWTDGGIRSLSHSTQVEGGSSNMTVDACTAACASAGYTLAGVEYADECYCDDFLSSSASNTSLTDCNMLCAANSSEFCGAGNRLNLYAAGSAIPAVKPVSKTPPPPAGWASLGCFNDSVGARTLSNAQYLDSMTIEECTSACAKAGYTFAGTEYGGECYCDNAIQNYAALNYGGPAVDGGAGCNMACAGTVNEMCGGPDRLNVYQYNASALPATSTSSSATGTATSGSDNDNNGGNDNAGCYTEGNGGRAFSNQMPDNDTMTVESCIQQCSDLGYTIAAMEYSHQCFCDNYIRNSPSRAPESSCSMACAGNKGEICGAGSILSVYTVGNMTAYINPSTQSGNLPGQWTYMGCLSDADDNRSLPYEIVWETNNTNTACLEQCALFGYNAAGTEYGQQCYCGDVQNVIDAGATLQPESECNMVCSGNQDGNGGHICGGPSRLSYYTWNSTMYDWDFASGVAAGAYEFLIGGPVIPLVTAPARNGKVTYLEKFGTSPANNGTGAYELDLSLLDDFTAAWRPMHVKSDIFCSASLTLPDKVGRQINIGGWANEATYGIRLYWPDGKPGVAGVNDWQENGAELSLLNGRWYPTAMTMANGSILVMGGEVGSNGAAVPTLEVLPSPSGEVIYCDYLDRTDKNNLYPFLAVLPSGGIFVGYDNEARILDPVSLQTKQVLPNMPGAVNNFLGARTYQFSGVMMLMPQYAPYNDYLRVVICGGSVPGPEIALDNCVSIAPDQPNANWTIERMPSKRIMPCMTALPDGTYLILNGAQQGRAGFGLATEPNYNAVLYDPSKPVNFRMTVMANTTVARLYHSEAVLLDDGRVLVSGSDPEDVRAFAPQEYRNEVFMPPYLLSGAPRPSFNLSNLDWSYGQSVTFSITPRATVDTSGYRVSLLGAVSSTHGNSMGQRTYFPTTRCSGTICTVTAPPNANVCPPSWFQMFLLDGNNVPSNATWVRIGGDPAGLGNWPDLPDFDVPGMGAVEAIL
ncbi:hypothetical protein BAUCODRAFT_114446 [Baudoinia panamericana UAMH 10762]|uniref:WSC domain-containing protein n=1 Tax=Baudoinia panamericana (strain UAMH 10762) TaxID=717646 RepID=M2MMM0_BAUPA|nr:uncharacterized protein BAUCODRAFT_114446 [Baudoinia panamericana UAMH 10762]EMC92658.1 hypothetical protein BAUCODRAFT_114446 [Baudoinia panamericana UAMH 10762]